ncbi:hypothetical protein DRH27_00345 [Candidatus Falkowbacteria bacterium]|nr:MAG: hypothetical protein DRH27_00345 [Candidatus Falkowbacteria bacterium]
MLIGIDASRANRDHKSGTEWYSYYLIRWLAKLDSKNQYILYTDEPLKGGLIDLTTKQYIKSAKEEPIKFDKNGLQIIKSPFNNFRVKILKWPSKYFWTQGRLSLEMAFRRPDVLFVPAHCLPFIHPKNSIVTIHDIAYEKEKKYYEQEQMGPGGKKSRKILNFLVKIYTLGKYKATTIDYLKWSTEYTLKHAKKIITVSNYTKKDLVELYKINANKISVVYNGYNRELYKKINNKEKIEEILNKYGIAEPYLLYVGRIEKKKNIPSLIEAFAMMREKNFSIKEKLVLIGSASFGYDETQYQIREFDITDEIVLAGWIIEDDLPYIFNGASGFVFPSHYEGFGIPLLQAMASGIPIAASNTSSIPEVAAEAAVYFNPCDTEDMAKTMDRLINDLSLRNNLIEKGSKRIENFSWEKCARETKEIIINI